MPRFYLHLRCGPWGNEDYRGTALPDGVAARAAARKLLRDLWGEFLFRGIDPMQCCVEVVNEEGMVVAVVSAALALLPND
jgi:hypothetical protein